MNTNDIKLIKFERVPCWYELSWDEPHLSIILSLHSDLLSSLGEIPADNRIVMGLAQELGFKSFAGKFNSDIGFENSLKRRGERNGFVDFVIELPKVWIITDKACRDCGGDKKRDDIPCIYCRETGKQFETNWGKAEAISGSLTVLTNLIEYTQTATSSPVPQLLTFHTMTRRDMHGGSLHGAYSLVLCNWLARRNDEHLYHMERAMQKSYCHMMTDAYLDAHDFRATVESSAGWLNVSCPGDACGLNPSYGQVRMGEGYEWSCHNVDNAAQQLTLIAGLAALHDQARKEMK